MSKHRNMKKSQASTLLLNSTSKDDWGEEKLIEEKKAASTLGAKRVSAK